MLKHNDIIASLSDGQKVRLLTSVGSLTGKDFKILGLNGVSVRNMKDYARDIIPSYASLSHSWSKDVFYKTAKARVNMLQSDGAGFAIAPGAKIKLSPYRREISEDPRLASLFSEMHLKAAKDAGIPTGAAGYYLTESELSWLDREPSERVLNEMISKPFMTAVENSGADAVITDERTLNDAYRRKLTLKKTADGVPRWQICAKATEENTVFMVSNGVICLEGSQNALETALQRYNKFMAAAERGESVTPEQIAEMQSDCSIISPEDIDRALDSVIDFLEVASFAGKEDIEPFNAEGVAKDSVLRSAVLLKNRDKALPLTKDRSLAVIGNILPKNDGEYGEEELIRELSERGYRCVGHEPGYNVKGDENLARANAVSLAREASTVILLLGFGYENEKRVQKTETLTLPADQLRLAHALTKTGKRVIGVIASGHSVDIEFTRSFKALLFMPLYVKSSPAALAELLSGEASPSGKLAYTLYAGSDGAFNKRNIYKERYGLKSGPFVGYRYYTTAGQTVGYPFGHGLTYSSFRYSNLKILGDTAQFTLQNTGDRAATEIVQLYIGHTASAVLRPKYELCSFEEITLGKGEKTTVKLKLDVPNVYENGEYLTESGKYSVSVGSSSTDIRLSAEIYKKGSELKPDGQKVRDYIQSVTNITEDNFTLEANYGFMKRSIKNLVFGTVALMLAASLAIFNATAGIESLFLGIVAGIIAVCAIIFFVNDYAEKSKLHEEEKKKIKALNKKHFDGAEELPMLSSDLIFKEEFDHVEKTVEEKLAESDDSLDELMRQYVEPDFKIANAIEDFKTLARDRGFKLSEGVAERFISALATSNLLIADGLSSEDFNSFIMLASEYFGTGTYVDKIELGEERQDMFFAADEYGNSMKRPTLLALDEAALEGDRIFITALDGLDVASLKEFLKPFLAYVSSPREENEIVIYNELGANVGYTVSKNLRIIVRLSDLASVDMLPFSTLQNASYSIISFVKSPIPETSSLHHGCNRYQLDYIADKEGHAHRISEENYKKIDKIEKYASQRTDFRISNKQMIAFEKQTCLLISANGEIAEAIDSALATRILPAVSAAVRDNLKEEDDSLKDTLEFVYGEENMPAASAFIEMQEEAKTKISNAEARLNEELARKASAENALLEKTEESKDETDAPEAIVAEETEAPVAEETEAETEAEAVAEESETAEEAEAVAEESETAEEAEATEDSADSENDESTAEA